MDIEEKSAQVWRMKDIYCKASEVIIWLGPEANQSSLALALATRIHRYWCHQIEVLGTLESAILNVSHAELWRIVDFRSLEAFSLLLSREWWERIWIVQEATTPSSTKTVQCGNSATSWDALIVASTFITYIALRPDCKAEFEQITPINQLSNRRLFNLDNLRKAGQTSNDLFTTLADFRHFKATDPRDKIYAILGILGENLLEDFAPDYSLDVSVVYGEAAKHCILKQGNLD